MDPERTLAIPRGRSMCTTRWQPRTVQPTTLLYRRLVNSKFYQQYNPLYSLCTVAYARFR